MQIRLNLRRSPTKAQNTYVHTLEAAEETHGDGEAAHRIAFASLKHSFEKIGDHWEPKAKKGPSDRQDAKRGNAARESTTKTAVTKTLEVGVTYAFRVAASGTPGQSNWSAETIRGAA